MNELDDFLFNNTEADPIEIESICDEEADQVLDHTPNMFLKDLHMGIKEQ